jgi:hypothetical protein
MSRILRRPMFRGGRVSSYGTGIAAPLVPGYQGGGQIGGGIIYGKPMADGRYGFADLEIDESTIGANVVKKAKDKTSNWEDLVALEEFSSVPKYDEDFLTNKFDSFVKGVERRVGYGEDDAFQTDVDLGMQLQPPIDPDDAAFWKIYNEDPEQAYKYWKENISTWGTKQKEQMEHAKKIGADVDYGIKSETSDIPEKTAEQLEIERLKKLLEERAVEPEVDATPSIGDAESDLQKQADEYFKLLGGDDARAGEISDMLLRFAGSKGDTVMEKFTDFAATESKIPSETKKIKQAAAMAAIKGDQAKETAMYAMQKGVALKLAGLTDTKKDRATTTRLGDYAKEFMKDVTNPFKQKNAGAFAAAQVLSENLLDKQGEFVSVMVYDEAGEAKPVSGAIYIDPIQGMAAGTPFYYNGKFYKTLAEAKKIKSGG